MKLMQIRKRALSLALALTLPAALMPAAAEEAGEEIVEAVVEMGIPAEEEPCVSETALPAEEAEEELLPEMELPEAVEEALEEAAVFDAMAAGNSVTLILSGGGYYRYQVYRSVNDSAYSLHTGLRVISQSPTLATWYDFDVIPGYRYRYRACSPYSTSSGDGVIAISTAVTVSTEYVTNIRATALSGSSIRVDWNIYPGAARYRVYRSAVRPSGDGWDGMELAGETAQTSFTDEGLKPSTTYYYRVFAAGFTTKSFLDSATTEAVVLSGLRAEAEEEGSAVRLYWQAFSGAKTYDVYRSETSPANGTDDMERIATVTGTGYTDTATRGDTIYYYCVEATGLTWGSKTVTVTTNMSLLPDRVTAYGGVDCISWDPVMPDRYLYYDSNGRKMMAILHAGTYLITRSDRKDGTYTSYAMVRNNEDGSIQANIYDKTSDASVTWSGSRLLLTSKTAADQGKYYKVTIYGTTYPVAVIPSNAVYMGAVKVGAVSGITGQPVYTNAARITWKAASGASGYQLFRASSENGTYTWVKNNPTTNVVNYVLTPGADYWYKVRGYYEYGDGTKVYGAYSQAVKVHNLGAIGNFSVRGLDTNCALLQWDRVEGCTGYQVFRTVAGSGEYQWVKNATTSRIANYGLTAGTTYYYKVRAYIDLPGGGRAYGQYSEGIRVAIQAKGRITGAACENGKVQLTWEAVPGVTGYHIAYLVGGSGGVYTWVMTVPAAKTAATVTKYLEQGKTIYYRVRSYIDNPDGSRCYGQYSEAVPVTIR